MAHLRSIHALGGLLLLCIILTACSGGEDSSATPPPANITVTTSAESASLNLTGQYRGTFFSTMRADMGSVAMELFQSDGNGMVTGTVVITGSPCFRNGTVVGQVSDTAFQGFVQLGGGIEMTLMALFSSDGESATGGYAVNMNSTPCSHDQGQFVIVR